MSLSLLLLLLLFVQDAGEDSDAKLVDYSILYDHTVRATLWREVSQKLPWVKTCVSLGVLPLSMVQRGVGQKCSHNPRTFSFSPAKVSYRGSPCVCVCVRVCV